MRSKIVSGVYIVHKIEYKSFWLLVNKCLRFEYCKIGARWVLEVVIPLNWNNFATDLRSCLNILCLTWSCILTLIKMLKLETLD